MTDLFVWGAIADGPTHPLPHVAFGTGTRDRAQAADLRVACNATAVVDRTGFTYCWQRISDVCTPAYGRCP